jgi:acyl-coenzyme A thioesterase 13
MGSLALSSRGLWMTGVSTDISVTQVHFSTSLFTHWTHTARAYRFVRAAALGETISLKAEVIGQGK